MNKPPLSLALPTFVVEYAIVPKSVKHIPSKKLWAGDRWLGAVPRLAICKDYLSNEFCLTHCDDEWEHLCGVEFRETIDEIKMIAEKHYPGITDYWKKTGYKEPDAIKQRNEIIEDNTCNFCEKSSYDIGNLCIKDFYEAFYEKNT